MKNILALAHSQQEVQRELNGLKEKVERDYADLPADLAEAQIEVAELKDKLCEKEIEFEKRKANK